MPVETIQPAQRHKADSRPRPHADGVIEVKPFPWRADDGSLAVTAPRWHVIHTKPRQEKAVARTLEAAEIEYFLPLMSRTAFRGRRKLTVQKPLFSSYLFMRGTTEATYFATATKRIANVIAVADQQRLIRELDQIRLALLNEADLGPSRYLKVGRRVRVTAGPFQDIEGLIEERLKPDRLVLQIAALGRATSLEIDADLLEPVD